MARLKHVFMVILPALILFLIAHVYVTNSILTNNYKSRNDNRNIASPKLFPLSTLGQRNLRNVNTAGRLPNIVVPGKHEHGKRRFNSAFRLESDEEVSARSSDAMVASLLWRHHPLSAKIPMDADFRSAGHPEKFALRLARMKIQMELFGIQSMQRQHKFNGTHEVLPLVDEIVKRQIAIVTYWRSGSTFLGEILNQSPGTFYHFEPLHAFTINEVINTTEREVRAQDLILDLLRCNYTHLDPKYLQWLVTSSHQFLIVRNTRLWNVCRMRKSLCTNALFLHHMCREYPTQLVKVVRLRISATRRLLVDNPDLRIVYLVRDPRGLYSSRKGLDWCNSSRSCRDPSEVCSQLRQDILTALELQQEFPERFTALRYEDISIYPEERTKELFQFLRLEFTRQVSIFLRSHTILRPNEKAGNPYSIKRNSKITPFLWRHKLTFNETQRIQDECADVMQALHYPPIRNEEELTRDNVNYVDWLYSSYEGNNTVL